MRRSTFAVLLLFVASVHPKESVANHNFDASDSMEKLSNKLVDRAQDSKDSLDKVVNELATKLLQRGLGVSRFNHETIDSTTLGKPGQFAISPQSRPVLHAFPHHTRSGYISSWGSCQSLVSLCASHPTTFRGKVAFPCKRWRPVSQASTAASSSEVPSISIAELKASLKMAVKSENYTEASRLRDEITALQFNSLARVTEANDKFYDAFRSTDVNKMREIWGEGHHVQCMHPGLPCVSSSDEVLQSWEMVFSGMPEGTGFNITTHDVQLHAGHDWGVVTCIEQVYSNGEKGNVLAATNVFERQNGRWVIIHHQANSIREELDARKGFLGHYEAPGEFAFRVGDIVVHRIHGQVGVVAERFDKCQLGPEWLTANAPPGMNPFQPYYTILVSMPGQNFTRHGAQSSHRRWDSSVDGGSASPIDHPEVATLFGELSGAEGRYKPLDAAAAAQEVDTPEWDRRSNIA